MTTVERLLDAHRNAHPGVVVPAFEGRRGHPVLWDASLCEELRTSPDAARVGARAVARAHPDASQVIPVDDPAVVDALDTPEDYERLVRNVNRDLY
jgi:molybdenum cofactor cytidylyltransferase